MSDDSYSPANRTGIARRVHVNEARRAFAAGATVLVDEHGDRETFPTYRITTTHTAKTTTWDELYANVTMWRSRYPRQRFYIVDLHQWFVKSWSVLDSGLGPTVVGRYATEEEADAAALVCAVNTAHSVEVGCVTQDATEPVNAEDVEVGDTIRLPLGTVATVTSKTTGLSATIIRFGFEMCSDGNPGEFLARRGEQVSRLTPALVTA